MADDESRRAGAEITALAHAIEDLCRKQRRDDRVGLLAGFDVVDGARSRRRIAVR